jgi:hypothetical protein
MHITFRKFMEKGYSVDRLGNSYYYIGLIDNINMDNVKTPAIIIDKNNTLMIQWRCYNTKNNTYITLCSEIILYDIESYKKSLEAILNKNVYDSDQHISTKTKNYHIFVKIIRKDLGPKGFI